MCMHGRSGSAVAFRVSEFLLSSFLLVVGVGFICSLVCPDRIFPAQSLGTSGTIRGAVVDPSGAVVRHAIVEIQNPVSGYLRQTKTDSDGKFTFVNVPFNPYHLTVTHRGFQPAVHDVDVESGLPVMLKISLQVAVVATTVTVTTQANDLIEKTPTAHTDVDRSLIANLPIQSPSIGLSQVITNATPGVVADANGFFILWGNTLIPPFLLMGSRLATSKARFCKSGSDEHRAVDGSDFRHAACPVRRHDQFDYQHHHEVGPWPAGPPRQLRRSIRFIRLMVAGYYAGGGR